VSTLKGNDIKVLPPRPACANPSLRIYKPWLDQAFINDLRGPRTIRELDRTVMRLDDSSGGVHLAARGNGRHRPRRAGRARA